MALEAWLIKLKAAITQKLPSPNANKHKKKPNAAVGVLALEAAGLLSKLLHLTQSLSDKAAILRRLRALEGVRKLVSADDAFLLALACAESVDTLRAVAYSAAAAVARRCADPKLRALDRSFREFAASGRDPHRWAAAGRKEIDARSKKMDRLVAATAALFREMDDLSAAEANLKRSQQGPQPPPAARIADLRQKISLQKQHVRYLKKKSLWGRSFDWVASLLARSIFTALARFKLSFGLALGVGIGLGLSGPTSLPRSLSASAAVYPSENPAAAADFASGPLMMSGGSGAAAKESGVLESSAALLKAAAAGGTLGAAALAVHYANLIMVMERMIKSPQLIGAEARDDLYGMLPRSLRAALRERLKGVELGGGDDARLAGEWSAAMERIMGWLGPMASNMLRWQSERSFERQKNGPGGGGGVLLVETLFFADREKTEAAITELLVGLNYVWRYEREMSVKALFNGSNLNLNFSFDGMCNLQSQRSI